LRNFGDRVVSEEKKKPVYEKMSKSRGNVVLPEEVVYGVAHLDDGYEFRLPDGKVIEDYLELGIWQDGLNSKMFFTATRYGRVPVFLHCKGNPVPAMLLLDGEEKLQHPDLVGFWIKQLEQNEKPD
jgi:hypothetical protein